MSTQEKPLYEPTMQDVARAAAWLSDRFGASRITADDVESLSWLLAEMRRKGPPAPMTNDAGDT